jgi:hypothetical protein
MRFTKRQVARFRRIRRLSQQHIGDINRVLRLNGCSALEWH